MNGQLDMSKLMNIPVDTDTKGKELTMGKDRTRNESGFRNANSKDGSFSPHISKSVTERLTRYCKDTNQNRTRFVEKCITERLEVLEKEFLESKSKEELIALLLQR